MQRPQWPRIKMTQSLNIKCSSTCCLRLNLCALGNHIETVLSAVICYLQVGNKSNLFWCVCVQAKKKKNVFNNKCQ